jgi:hypothetical protein
MTDSDSGGVVHDTHMTGTEAHDASSEPQSPPATRTSRLDFKGWWIGIHPEPLSGQGPIRHTDTTASVNPAVPDGSISANTENSLKTGHDSQQETGCKLEEAPRSCQVATKSEMAVAAYGKGGQEPCAFWT